MTAFTVWLLFVVIPNFTGVCIVITIILGASIFAAACRLESEPFSSKERANVKKRIRNKIGAIVILAISSGFIPTQKEMAVIYLVPAITNNIEFQKLPNNLLYRINTILTNIDNTEDRCK